MDRVERKLSAILAADVAGYSRLMGIDEEGTHKDLKAHAASTRAWPAMRPVPPSINTGTTKPNSAMLAASLVNCRFECARALFGYGLRACGGRYSTESAPALGPSFVGLVVSIAVHAPLPNG